MNEIDAIADDGRGSSQFLSQGDCTKGKNVKRSIQLSRTEVIDVQPQMCFYNCFKAVTHCSEYREVDYVEGMVVGREGFAFEHGWLETASEIIDPTLPEDKLTYFAGLRVKGVVGIGKIMRETNSSELPLFFRYGWGGCELPSFVAARQEAMRLEDHIISEDQLPNDLE